MGYVTRAVALSTCKKLRDFYLTLKSTYDAVGIDLGADRGRRNMMLSGPMEKFLAEALSESGVPAVHNGTTGKADVIAEVNSRDVEIECKLTSPHKSSNSISFQTDYQTLAKKGPLDYCYIIANPQFDAFVFLHFVGLDINDFRQISPGARGKVAMYKYQGIKKCSSLVGETVNRKEVRLTKLRNLRREIFNLGNQAILDLKDSIKPTTDATQRKEILDKIIKTGRDFQSRINKTDEKIKITNNRNPSYSFKFEEIK